MKEEEKSMSTNQEEHTQEELTDVEEFVFDDGGEEDLRATLKKLRKDLKDAQKEKQEYLTNWQKERADFVNYKKDEEVRRKLIIERTREDIIESLLPILDSYDMAFSNREAWEKVDKNWRTGVEYIHQQLVKVLSDYGVTEIAPSEGAHFDATLHQPIETVETDDASQDHTIARLLQKGYRTNERVVRAARVNVFSVKK